MSDPINPDHYRSRSKYGVECIEIAENWNYNLGAALKYLWRAGIKTPDPTTDLRKAIWHIEREIERVAALNPQT